MSLDPHRDASIDLLAASVLLNRVQGGRSSLWIAACILLAATLFLYATSIVDPLSHIPGPFTARFSGLRQLFYVWIGRQSTDVWECHEKYGPVVRYAPNRLLFRSPTAIREIYSSRRNITKASGYDTKPYERQHASLFNTVDHDTAAVKKKALAPVNSEEAHTVHQAAVLEQTETMMKNITSSRGPINVSTLAFRYSLDAISHSILGSSFNLLRKPTNRWLPHSVLAGNRHMYIQLTAPRLFSALSHLIDISRFSYPTYHTDGDAFTSLVDTHLSRGSSSPSIHRILRTSPTPTPNDPDAEEKLKNDIATLLRAGGDTVAAALSAFFFYISRSPSASSRLRTELHSAFNSYDDIRTGAEMDSCVFLRACVDETLRMAPPAPGVFWREATEEMVVDGVRVPKGTEIGVGVYSMHHDERVFAEPFEFRPERFLEGGRKAREGFMPFLKGFRACPAQRMAYTMLLVPVARVMWRFEVERVGGLGGGMEKGATGWRSEDVYQHRDCFSAMVDGPVAIFRDA